MSPHVLKLYNQWLKEMLTSGGKTVTTKIHALMSVVIILSCSFYGFFSSLPYYIFAIPWGREFDNQSLPGGGELDPHEQGVANWNHTLDFM